MATASAAAAPGLAASSTSAATSPDPGGGGSPDVSACTAAAPAAAAAAAEYRFPWWWFVVLCLPNFVVHFVSAPLWGLIWPSMLAQLSGQKYETIALAAGGQIGVIVSYASPVIGSLSDKLPERHARHCGRRRPFIISGCCIGACGIALTIDALYRIIRLGHGGTDAQYAWAYGELALSLVVGNVGGNVEKAPWNAIIPDTVSPVQRGQAVMVVSWCNTILQLCGGGLGYVVGQALPCFGRQPCLSDMDVWWLNAGVLLAVIPVYYVACNGRAVDGCSRRSLCKPEQPPARKPAAATAAGVEDADVRPASQQDNVEPQPAPSRPRRCCEGGRELLAEFTSAFKDSCFRWYWLYRLVNEFGGIISGSFTLYWYKDCFPHGYYVFGWKVADTAISATAINLLIGQVLHIGVMPLVQPHWWRDRFGGR
jgi:Na+/melibiose symporter-like transporter